jgi:hypothetical protein
VDRRASGFWRPARHRATGFTWPNSQPRNVGRDCGARTGTRVAPGASPKRGEPGRGHPDRDRRNGRSRPTIYPGASGRMEAPATGYGRSAGRASRRAGRGRDRGRLRHHGWRPPGRGIDDPS